MEKLILSMSLITSLTFSQMNHPLAMGLMLMIQTILMAVISGLMHQSFWFSYVLFLVFMGGMLILFIYVTSLASNEMFHTSTKMMMAMVIMFAILLLSMNSVYNYNNHDSLPNEEMTTNTFLILSKLYNLPTGTLTIMLALYLLLTLIVVVKITNLAKGPLRQMS
uniref:NADH-ubiquinone oxidoreductase chain 6 n=1 Tax=Mastotermes darwiniensis TaxID=13139 RepID=I6U298_MASDA|nr:NADH dehydrogenase subunit 6 [Mastotermes darwiniensis]AFM92393.1 NADH dehydrogenase subunit 6 [Mastotermes darwiniensis]UZC33344.1 NADH dehydrogenase subunit 6 [Mastotermes darwiniensis]